MTTTQKNIDGRYIVWPDGSCWNYYRIRNGEVVSQTTEANLDTHVAARDQWAWIADLDFDELPQVDRETAEAVLHLLGETGAAENYSILRIERR